MEGHFKITLHPMSHRCTIELNGEDISGMVRGIRIRASVGEVTMVDLECMPKLVDIEGLSRFDLTAPLILKPEATKDEVAGEG